VLIVVTVMFVILVMSFCLKLDFVEKVCKHVFF